MNLNGVRIVPYKPEHFFQIVRRAYEIQTLKELPDPEFVAKSFMNGWGYTAFIKDKILLSAGVMKVWEGVGEAWLVASPLIHKYPLLSTKGIYFYLDRIIKENGLKRVQAVVQKDFHMANRWIQLLGFEYEGEMPNYRAGKTFIRYAKILKEN